MKTVAVPTPTLAAPAARGGLLDRLARLAVRALAEQVRAGEVTLAEGDDRRTYGRATGECPLRATLTVHDPAFYRALAFGGSVGAGEAYCDGAWDCDDLVALVRILIRNRELFLGLEGRWARLAQPLYCLAHRWRGNGRAGSRRNIAAHYDLGNAFFAEFLDETMSYSCAYFERPDAPLAEASRAKNDRICRKLALAPADHLLEIGTGWGEFALHAARRYGCRVTTTTISRAQHEFARERVRAAGLTDRVEVLLEDYRELRGCFDKLVSVEMIEAIGAEQYETYFRRCGGLLRPEGAMLLQTITIADRDFEQHRRSVDFIKRHIFPGSCLPSVTALCAAMSRGSDLRLAHLEDLTAHYATTLERWRERFRANRGRIAALGYPERFLRMWEFYFGYCEAPFRERYTGDVQMLFTGPGWRGDPAGAGAPA